MQLIRGLSVTTSFKWGYNFAYRMAGQDSQIFAAIALGSRNNGGRHGQTSWSVLYNSYPQFTRRRNRIPWITLIKMFLIMEDIPQVVSRVENVGFIGKRYSKFFRFLIMDANRTQPKQIIPTV